MNKFDKSIENILKLVKEQPSDYSKEKAYIIGQIQQFINKNEIQTLDNWLYTYICDLPNRESWQRKHIYLLVHELLHIDNLYSYLGTILYDIESGIVGDCAIESAKRYSNEPLDFDAFTMYIRNYEWL